VKETKEISLNECRTGALTSSLSPSEGERVAAGRVRGKKRLGTIPGLRDERPAACSHLNQSLMELGALICTPRSPGCHICPLQKHCVAFRENRVEQLPNLPARAAATERRFVAFVVEHRGRILLQQRPAGVVNAHLWEFPNLEANNSEAKVADLAGTILPDRDFTLSKLCVVKHSITRYRITLEAWRVINNAEKKSRLPEIKKTNGVNSKWLTLDEADSLAFTSAHRKILNRLIQTKITKKVF
jgi:A/G-specific adenine glycosylase